MAKKKSIETQRISFLKQKKTVADKFQDLVKEYVSPVFYNTEEMEVRGLTETTFKQYKGIATLSKKLKVSPSVLKRWIKNNKVKPNKAILNEYNKLKRQKKRFNQPFDDFKKTTKEFTVHNFTRKNFFKKPKKKLKKYDEYHFRAGLYIVFERIKKVSTGIDENPKEKQNMYYVIQNFPISSYSKDFSKGYEKIYEDIKYELNNHPSLKYFRLNYFDVIIVNTKAI